VSFNLSASTNWNNGMQFGSPFVQAVQESLLNQPSELPLLLIALANTVSEKGLPRK
jgi:hypothetical protein